MVFDENSLRLTATVRLQKNKYFKNVIYFSVNKLKYRDLNKTNLLFTPIFKIMGSDNFADVVGDKTVLLEGM